MKKRNITQSPIVTCHNCTISIILATSICIATPTICMICTLCKLYTWHLAQLLRIIFSVLLALISPALVLAMVVIMMIVVLMIIALLCGVIGALHWLRKKWIPKKQLNKVETTFIPSYIFYQLYIYLVTQALPWSLPHDVCGWKKGKRSRDGAKVLCMVLVLADLQFHPYKCIMWFHVHLFFFFWVGEERGRAGERRLCRLL